MKRISTKFYVVGFLLGICIPSSIFAQDFNKVKIQIYREFEPGQITQKDTIISLKDLDKVAHLLGPGGADTEAIRTAIFLAAESNTRIKTKVENGRKTIQIGQFEGDDLEGLDEETKKKVQEAFKVANIPEMEEKAAGSSSSVETDDPMEKERTEVDWNGKVIENDNLNGQQIVIDRNDLSENQEKELLEAMKSGEVSTLLDEMNVDIAMKGERPPPPPKKVYHIGPLTPREEHMFRKSGLIGIADTLAISHLNLRKADSTYILAIETGETGEMAITLKHLSGNILMRESHPTGKGIIEKEIFLGTTFSNFYFLTIAQNGKISHRRIFPGIVEEPLPEEGSN
ncbi:MAG: hypothetical protein AAF694_17265 [Bacteroidota bacterium]